MQSFRVTTPANEACISVAEAVAHCNARGNADEVAWFTSAIAATEALYTANTGRQLVSATYTLTATGFPSGYNWTLPHASPLASVTSVQYYDVSGTLQTFASTNYYVDTSSEPGRLWLAPNAYWPSTQSRANAVIVTYVAGYGTAASVPDIDKAAVKLLVANWYDNREAVVVGTIAATLPFAVEAIQNIRRVIEVG